MKDNLIGYQLFCLYAIGRAIIAIGAKDLNLAFWCLLAAFWCAQTGLQRAEALAAHKALLQATTPKP
jgi:hypothetical protein